MRCCACSPWAAAPSPLLWVQKDVGGSQLRGHRCPTVRWEGSQA